MVDREQKQLWQDFDAGMGPDEDVFVALDTLTGNVVDQLRFAEFAARHLPDREAEAVRIIVRQANSGFTQLKQKHGGEAGTLPALSAALAAIQPWAKVLEAQERAGRPVVMEAAYELNYAAMAKDVEFERLEMLDDFEPGTPEYEKLDKIYQRAVRDLVPPSRPPWPPRTLEALLRWGHDPARGGTIDRLIRGIFSLEEQYGEESLTLIEVVKALDARRVALKLEQATPQGRGH